MGAWGVRAFDNDTANDWAYGLEETDDLSLLEETLELPAQSYLDQHAACEALAACEVIARLRGKTDYTDAYTEKVDKWVAEHRLVPSPALQAKAVWAIDRILGDGSELRDLWSEGGEASEWLTSVRDLRHRVTGKGGDA